MTTNYGPYYLHADAALSTLELRFDEVRQNVFLGRQNCRNHNFSSFRSRLTRRTARRVLLQSPARAAAPIGPTLQYGSRITDARSMFIGHFAVALAGKRAAPSVSLATWFASVQ